MTTIYLIRHAEAEGNLYRRIQGWYDALVTDNGLRQIQALERRFAGLSIDAVYSSDLYRTRATARAVYLPKNLPLHTDPGLREINMGDWEDRTWGEVQRSQPDQMLLFNRSDPAWRAPNGESYADVGDRMERTIRRIARSHPDQTIALFSHGTAIRQVAGQIKGVAPRDWHTLPHHDNTAVTCLAWDGQKLHLIFEGDNSHLDESISTLARQSWWRRDGKRAEDVNFWFRPLDAGAERERYLQARQEAWVSAHGRELPFDGEGFWQQAVHDLSLHPMGVSVAMLGERPAGIIQLDARQLADEGVGFIPFCCLFPEFRSRGLGVQLIGHAVSLFRPMGRTRLCLHCPPDNQPAQHFYAKYGFTRAGQQDSGGLTLDILEKYIGLDR